jgi:hypothetical protein
MRTESLTDWQLQLLNRHVVDAAWPESLHSYAKRFNQELQGFVTGTGDGTKKMAELGDIPWSAWKRPLMIWLPLFLVFCMGMIGLALVVHRQWSVNESLPYPVARFSDSLIPDQEDGRKPIYKQRMFLVAAGIIMCIHLLNYGNTMADGKLVAIPLRFDASPLQALSQNFEGGYMKWALFTLRVFPVVVGLSYFLGTQVSFSLGLATPFAVLLAVFLQRQGISNITSREVITPYRSGAYLGLFAMFVYTGRRYYWAVLMRALGKKETSETVDQNAVWGGRVFGVCLFIMIVQMSVMGIDWFYAIPLAALTFYYRFDGQQDHGGNRFLLHRSPLASDCIVHHDTGCRCHWTGHDHVDVLGHMCIDSRPPRGFVALCTDRTETV